MMKPESYVGSLVLRRYRLDNVISSGGMGVLYGATHLRTGRRVAIKFLLDGDDNQRFVLEARAAAELKHPNVVDVIDMDEDDDGVLFLVLELLEGQSLAGVLFERPRLGAEQLLAWMLPVMGALAVAHDRGILHRDLKPANIFIANAAGGRTVPKLLDFGVAKVQSQPTLTRSGSVVGTPSFMSPEQARGDRDLLAATDVWGMGVILFRCLTGRLPFEHEAVIGTLMRIVNERAPRVETVASDVPRALGWAIDRALQHDPAVRYPDMRAFARALLAAALRDNIPLPVAPDPTGFPDWSTWLAQEQSMAKTGAVPATPQSGALTSQPPPLPPFVTPEYVEFSATQTGVQAVTPTLKTRTRSRSRLWVGVMILGAFVAGLLAYLRAPEAPEAPVSSPPVTVAAPRATPAVVRLEPEIVKPAAAAPATPAQVEVAAPTPPAGKPVSVKPGGNPPDEAAKRRADRRKVREPNPKLPTHPKPVAPSEPDNLAIESKW